MKILMVLIGHDFPPDIRVEKELRALLAAGHKVLVICENRKSRPAREMWNGAEIYRLPQVSPTLRKLNRAQLFTTGRSYIWECQIRKIVESERPDVLHVHDLPFIGPALRISQRSNVPVIADLHENYPALLALRKENPTYGAFDRAIFNAARFSKYESAALPGCVRVIVVVEEAADRLIQNGIEPNRIVIVGNTEDIDEVEISISASVTLQPSELRLLYVGGFGHHRGLHVVIRAMPDIRSVIPSAVFVIVGDGPDRVQLENRAEDLGVNDAVIFEGRRPFSEVHSYIEESDICLVPHMANEHTDATMPHKLFQYMYMAKPVIVSDAKPLARVVRETDSGLVFKSGDSSVLVDRVFTLQDRELRFRLGANGRKAVKNEYNWRIDGERLVAMYDSLSRTSN